ncbi:MAG: hypothetical protein PSX36_16240 [bacterium]|nr:hypothetical protein [bacterium]
MKKEDLPQDSGALSKFTREMCYVVDEKGNYITDLSSGWDVKTTALDATWKNIHARIESVRKKVVDKKVSPVLFFMEWRLMDIDILSAYTGLWKWQIRRHLKPEVFQKLGPRLLEKYARAFNITIEDLKTLNTHE